MAKKNDNLLLYAGLGLAAYFLFIKKKVAPPVSTLQTLLPGKAVVQPVNNTASLLTGGVNAVTSLITALTGGNKTSSPVQVTNPVNDQSNYTDDVLQDNYGTSYDYNGADDSPGGEGQPNYFLGKGPLPDYGGF